VLPFVTKTCLIIADRFEPTADCLLAELRRRNVACLRLNLDCFPMDTHISYRLGDRGFGGDISCDGRTVDLASIGSVWCRGFRPSGFPNSFADEDLKFVQDEAQRTLDALMTVLAVPWVNHPQNHARANSKAAQLLAAHRVGLAIPRTVVTNDPNEVRRFMAQNTGETIYKAHSQTLNLEPGKALYTGVLTSKEVDHLDLIRVSPGVFQEYVPKAYEIRATVVGTRIFSGKIESQRSDQTRIDWRRRPFEIDEEPVSLSREVETMMLELMRLFGLHYGAFDFIVTPDGRHVFLEVNPAGQYLWVETVTKMPITAALAELLGSTCS
jgi:hypothetical protein